ncbi:uncharacterized protein [Triticum aestivum]|uniref:uncharacterized protein n=1 Tax=Triticum aestivum TaxID=4565 RepID=UPI001D014144|nr:uncharacterized protein LOC123075912 [Triticum aestivum]
MTKIFRSSFYRSKQPEPPPEEESAAGEYVDLEDGQGKHVKTPGCGGGGSSASFALGRGICYILLGCALLGCSYLLPKPAQDSHFVAMIGALYLAIGAAALALYACTSRWRLLEINRDGYAPRVRVCVCVTMVCVRARALVATASWLVG